MTKDFRYSGFSSPNGTIVPDDVFDVIAPELTEAELRVLLYVVRRTFGFKKNADAISLGQLCNGIKTRDGRVLDRGTGMSRSAVIRGAQGLVEKGILVKNVSQTEDGENETNVYTLRFSEAAQDQKDEINQGNKGVVLQKDYPSLPKELPQFSKKTTVVLQNDPQETVLQQTDLSISNIRKRSHADFSGDNTATQSLKPARNGSVEREDAAGKTNGATSVEQTDIETLLVKAWGMEALGDILKKGRGRPSRREGEEREMILAFIRDFAREFHDQAQLKSSVTRAFNIYKESGLSPIIFQDRMYQARLVTKDYQSRSRIKGSPMAYYFRVLEDQAGVKESEYQPNAPVR